MWLVYEDKLKSGKWNIAWTWLPFFLSSDRDLHKHVATQMTEEFKGTSLEEDANGITSSMVPVLKKMHDRVISLILEKHPIPGLRQHLESIANIHPEEESSDVVG